MPNTNELSEALSIVFSILVDAGLLDDRRTELLSDAITRIRARKPRAETIQPAPELAQAFERLSTYLDGGGEYAHLQAAAAACNVAARKLGGLPDVQQGPVYGPRKPEPLSHQTQKERADKAEAELLRRDMVSVAIIDAALGHSSPTETPDDEAYRHVAKLRALYDELASMPTDDWRTEEPPEAGWYLVTPAGKITSVCIWYWADVWWHDGHPAKHGTDVLAWRHLPASYRPSDGDSHILDGHDGRILGDASVPKPLCSDVGAPSGTVVEPEDIRQRIYWREHSANGYTGAVFDHKRSGEVATELNGTELHRFVRCEKGETIAPPGAVVLTREQAERVRQYLEAHGDLLKWFPKDLLRALGIEVDGG